MSPIEQARAICADREIRWSREHPGEACPFIRFEDQLEDHMRNGFVLANGLYFVMAKAIQLPIKDPGRLIPQTTAGCWVVAFAVGPLPALLAAMPVRLPYIGFSRHEQNRLRIYKIERVIHTAARFARLFPNHQPGRPESMKKTLESF